MPNTDSEIHHAQYPIISPSSAARSSSLSLRTHFRTASGGDAHDPGNPFVTPIMSRTPSNASDRFSTVSAVTLFPPIPQHVEPAPAYVAPFGASQVVNEHQAAVKPTSSDEEDAVPQKDDVNFSDAGLALVNAFLDQLLYSFLATARSTALTALRPAITDVLKHRLARDAIASADEELHEMLASGDEEEEMNSKQNAAESNTKWDLELVWKRTRLRVMVYMRLGEMEDDDEDRYVREEDLFHSNERRFSQSTGLVSWAAAIFLTSVLEYIAEQTLQVAGQAAYNRARRQSRSQRPAVAATQTPLLVEEHDVEKVALNSTLGRLWRTWRKSLRNQAIAASPVHRMAMGRWSSDNVHGSIRRGSFGTAQESSVDGEPSRQMQLDDVPEMDHPEHVLAANIPLPMADHQRDVDEIELPGLAADPDADGDDEDDEPTPLARRNSFTGPLSYHVRNGAPTSESLSPEVLSSTAEKPRLTRQRSMSVPTPARTLMPANDKQSLPGAFPEEEATHEQPADEKEVEIVPEQKFAAEEMAPHKPLSADAKTLPDEVANGTPPVETEVPSGELKERSKRHGLVAGVVGGTSAAITAATIAMYGAKGQSDEQPADGQATAEQKYVEELDKRKSLLDMKSMIAEDKQNAEQRDAPAVEPKVPIAQARTGSAHSQSSYTLGDKSAPAMPPKSPAQKQHMASQADAADSARSAETEQDGGENKVETQEARGPATRPARLVLTPSAMQSADSVQAQRTDAPKTPQEFLASRSLVQPQKVQDGEGDTTRRPAPSSDLKKRKSVPGVALTSNAAQSPVIDRSPYREAWASSAEKLQQQQQQHKQQQQQQQQQRSPAQQDGSIRTPILRVATSLSQTMSAPAQPKSSTPASPVQEHPIVHRMASIKRSSGKTEPEVEKPVTSASIKGPEDFDMFVQGVDTVKYTLTPEAVRDQPTPRPAEPYPKHSQPVELSTSGSQKKRILNAPQPPPKDHAETRTGRSQVSKQATSASPKSLGTARPRAEDDGDKRRSFYRPPPRNTSAHRKSGLVSREPRVMTESTRDFADFIRSTGPAADPELKPLVDPATRSTTSLHSLGATSVNGSSLRTSSPGGDRTKSMTKLVVQSEQIPPVPPIPRKGKSNVQARTARAVESNTADLIDFFRSAPSQSGAHRAPRNVALPGKTKESDEIQDIGNRINGDKNIDLKLNAVSSRESSQPSSAVSRVLSARSSATSRSPLLTSNANATVHPAHSGQPQSLSSHTGNTMPPGGEPERKRYRNKDPYAIDLDDDDEDLLTALPTNKRQEESIMDFLNNAEPPKDNAPRPLMNGGSLRASNAASDLPGARSSSAAESSVRTKSLQSTGGPRAGNPSVQPQQRASSAVQASAAPPVQRPKLEARSPGDGARDRENTTRDLAAFLKDSGPSEDSRSAPAPVVGVKPKLPPKEMGRENKKAEKPKQGGLGGRLFSRGKRKTWLDMP